MSDPGYIPISRKLFEHAIWNDGEPFSRGQAWIDLLALARFATDPGRKIVNGKWVAIKRGQMVASIRFLQNRWNWNSTRKVMNYLDLLESDGMLERQTEQGISIITICKYETYNPLREISGTPNGTAAEQKRNTSGTLAEQKRNKEKKEIKEKNEKEREEKEIFEQIISHLNQKAGTNYRPTTAATQKAIRGRIADGFSLNDFLTVIDKKCREWKGTEMEKHLNPDTLFRPSNFEKYLNQKIIRQPDQKEIPIAKLKGRPKYDFKK